MSDREKVMKGLEMCQYSSKSHCDGCPYVYGDSINNCTADLSVDVLNLLKEQDSELSYRKAKAITHNATKRDAATCPSCGNVVGETKMWGERKVFIQWKYCIICGQKLDWEDHQKK